MKPLSVLLALLCAACGSGVLAPHLSSSVSCGLAVGPNAAAIAAHDTTAACRESLAKVHP